MTINLKMPDIRELKPRITVFGVGGAGGNAVNNMITAGLQGVDFVVANTDAQALTMSKAERIIQMGTQVTEGLGAGSQPEVGRAAAEEVLDEIRDHLSGAHMVFVTAGMGGGDEDHVRAREMIANFVDHFFRRGAADIGLGTRAEALGDLHAHLDDALGLRHRERLGVRIGHHEIDALQAGGDHVVEDRKSVV